MSDLIRHEAPWTRYELLSWARARALKLIETGNFIEAVVSLGADLDKSRDPVYPPAQQAEMLSQGSEIAAANDARGMRRWIEGFT